MSNWELPEPKYIVPELEDEYRAEPFTPEPSPGEIMRGSSIMDRLDHATAEQMRLWAAGGTGEVNYRQTEIGTE